MTEFPSSLLLQPIGVFHCPRKHRYETPRQGVLAEPEEGIIELATGRNFHQALQDLDGFDRIWILYQFHLNPNWKPMVRPPRHVQRKVGVFATRAPYRPNPIGLSCVHLVRIEGLNLHVAEYDLLDGSPVLDIKPYLPYADAFPDAGMGWTKAPDGKLWIVAFALEADATLDWMKTHGEINLRSHARMQLQYDPENSSRKRIAKVTGSESSDHRYELAYRTWRILYEVHPEREEVWILSLRSAYTDSELAEGEPDPHGDKELHRRFRNAFG